MKIVVGLGNPGKRYTHTPHNAGFSVVDAMADRLSCRFRKRWRLKGHTAEAVVRGQPLVLLKPDTYMNRSGAAVASLMRYRRASPEDVILVLDDADLDVGRLRIRPRGSSGGHRGLDSVIASLGTTEFCRVRVGIGRQDGEGLLEHVLKPLGTDARKRMEEIVEAAARAVFCIMEEGVEAAMNMYNGSRY